MIHFHEEDQKLLQGPIDMPEIGAVFELELLQQRVSQTLCDPIISIGSFQMISVLHSGGSWKGCQKPNALQLTWVGQHLDLSFADIQPFPISPTSEILSSVLGATHPLQHDTAVAALRTSKVANDSGLLLVVGITHQSGHCMKRIHAFLSEDLHVLFCLSFGRCT